ncbi:ankyrin repeat domain-containing protein [Candidatus Babela massiliensis]|uniref:Ankyrin repeats containing protein n=1 Tax=Candidatus Babela massiliensis TaxID=673862 RepID=V6DJY4_9BACT|nr:ankyrin repeat domain-containing protein [Candidatus Babela massiliensis]CDK30826.1 Ankyrin repeats containing protein [Candidatus Babela massiliensis]
MDKLIYSLILVLSINFISQAMQVTTSDKSNKEEKSLAVVKAAREGDISLFYQLFSEDIDVNQKDEYGRTALHYATLRGTIAIFHKLANSADIDANVQDNDGVTPLRMAAADRSVLCILALLELNADPYIKDKTGVSAADNAKQEGCTEMVTLFERFKKNDN